MVPETPSGCFGETSEVSVAKDMLLFVSTDELPKKGIL